MKQRHPISPGAIPGQVKPLLVIFLWGLISLTSLISFSCGVADAQTKNSAENSHTSQDKLSLAAGICVARAQALFQNGEVSRAISLLEEFKKKKAANHYYIHFLLGNYYLTLNQNQNASLCFEASVQQNPAFCAGWLNLAKSLYESGLFARAGVAFENGYKTSEIPKPIHLYYAGICYFQAGDPQKALAFAGFLTRTDPLEPKWWKALCQIHLNNNQYKQGVSALVIYGYLTPMTHEELMLAGDLYLGLDVPVKAARFYQAAIKETQTPSQVLKISQAYSLSHEPDKALAWIEKGLAIAKDIKLLRLKARILYRQKKYARAADAYERLAQTLLVLPPRSDKSVPDKSVPNPPDPKNIGQAWLMLGYAALNQNKPDHTQLARAQKAFLMAAGFKNQQKPARKALEQITILQAGKKLQKETQYADKFIKN